MFGSLIYSSVAIVNYSASLGTKYFFELKLHQRRPQILLRMTMSMLMTILIIMKMMMVVLRMTTTIMTVIAVIMTI